MNPCHGSTEFDEHDLDGSADPEGPADEPCGRGAARTVLAVDHTTFAESAPARLRTFEEIDTVITDRPVTTPIRAAAKAVGVDIHDTPDDGAVGSASGIPTSAGRRLRRTRAAFPRVGLQFDTEQYSAAVEALTPKLITC